LTFKMEVLWYLVIKVTELQGFKSKILSFSKGFWVSRSLGHMVLRFRVFWIFRNQGFRIESFKVSINQVFEFSKYKGFNIARFLRIKVLKFLAINV
jgi:hypothetical protein